MKPYSAEDLALYLDRTELLRGLSDHDRRALAEHVKVTSHEAGEQIMRKGDSGDKMMIVASGRLKVSSLSPRGSEFLIATMEVGGAVGELSLLDGEQRSADVTTLEPSVLLSLNRDVFRRFVAGNPEAAMRLMKTMAQRLRRTTTRIEETMFLELPARLARKIHDLAQECGEPCPQGVRVNHGLTQQELADSLGVARETVSKQLALWREGGLVEMQRRYLIVKEMDELALQAQRFPGA